MRGENLGRPIYKGSAIPNTGVPGMVGGYAMERLIKASGDGLMEPVAAIGDIVEKGGLLAYTGDEPVYAQIDGVIRGMLQADVPVKKGMKIGDVDPRKDESLVYLISDKSHKIGRGCVETIRTLLQRQFGIVVLAAGLSRRYGGNKLLEERISEEPLYEVTLDKLSRFSDCICVVVTRFDEIEAAAKQRGMVVVRNGVPELGISHSLHLGLLACLERNPYLRGVLFMVCDQPYLRAETMERMLEEGLAHPQAVVCASHEGRRGNPVLWDTCYMSDLLSLTGDAGGRQIIKKYQEHVRLVECGEKELQMWISAHKERRIVENLRHLYTILQEHKDKKEKRILTVLKGPHAGEKAFFAGDGLLWEKPDRAFSQNTGRRPGQSGPKASRSWQGRRYSATVWEKRRSW